MREPDLLALSADACAYAARGTTLATAERVPLPLAPERATWPAQAFARFGLSGIRAAPFELVLADSAAKYYVVTPPQGLQRFAELRDLAALRLEELFGTASAAWRISADWNSRRSFLCCAVANDLLAPLEAFAGARLLSAAPVFVRRFNAAAATLGRTPTWFVCCVGGWVSAAYFDSGACHCVRSTALPQADALARWLGHEALLANRPLAQVHLVAADLQTLTIAGANVHRIAATPREMRELQLLAALAASPTAVVA